MVQKKRGSILKDMFIYRYKQLALILGGQYAAKILTLNNYGTLVSSTICITYTRSIRKTFNWGQKLNVCSYTQLVCVY